MVNPQKKIEKPLVSVIIPSKDRKSLLLEAVASVLKQDYKPIEIIVVDDGSTTEDFEGIVSSLSEHLNVRVLQSNGNQGSSVARNLGIEAAQGDYITFLDDDDLMVRGKISGQVELMQSRDADFVTCTRFYYVVEEDQVLKGVKTDQVTLNDMWRRNIIVSVSPMATKVLIKQVKFDPSLTTGVDYDIWLRCILECKKSVNYQKPAIYHRRFYSGVTETSRRWRKFRGRFMILRKYRSYMPLKWQLYHVIVSMVKLIVPDPHFLLFRLKKMCLK